MTFLKIASWFQIGEANMLKLISMLAFTRYEMEPSASLQQTERGGEQENTWLSDACPCFYFRVILKD